MSSVTDLANWERFLAMRVCSLDVLREVAAKAKQIEARAEGRADSAFNVIAKKTWSVACAVAGKSGFAPIVSEWRLCRLEQEVPAEHVDGLVEAHRTGVFTQVRRAFLRVAVAQFLGLNAEDEAQVCLLPAEVEAAEKKLLEHAAVAA